MRKTILLVGILLISFGLEAQIHVEVPQVIEYADMRLELTPEARKKVQTDVDALTRYEKYFNAKVEKVNAHFPLIEQVLREENVPEDIKYLVIQESAFVGDAVSSSNAVGYWQFKAPTGKEVGLTINNEIDERMNIITATHGAARYFKNNNTFFDNWLYALLAYYAGPGGALKIADKKYYGAKRMKLDGRTHWYVIKYLAHKIAFGQAEGKDPNPEMVLFAYNGGNGKTLGQVAKEFDLETSDLDPYNKWIRRNRIPTDKEYFVIVPDYSGARSKTLLAQTNTTTPQESDTQTSAHANTTADGNTHYTELESTGRFPLIKQSKRWGKELTLINDIPGIVAGNNDNIRSLSQKTGVAPSRLVRFNDLTSKQSAVIPGQPYYTKRKRNKAPVHYHVVEAGESLWSVSQRFGIKLKKLMRNNRMREVTELKEGRVLWLRFIRPPHVGVEYRESTPTTRPQVKTTNKPDVASQQSSPQPKEVSQQPELGGSADNQQGWDTQEEKTVREEEKPLVPIFTKQPETTTSDTPSQTKPKAAAQQDNIKEKSPQEEEALVPAISKEGSSQAKNNESEYHSVKVGETLYGIARQHDLTIPQLTSYNDISWDSPLKVGQKLRLQAPDSEQEVFAESKEQPSFMLHEVKAGETMYKVARQYDVTIKELMEWNEKEDFSVSVGEKLKVRKR